MSVQAAEKQTNLPLPSFLLSSLCFLPSVTPHQSLSHTPLTLRSLPLLIAMPPQDATLSFARFSPSFLSLWRHKSPDWYVIRRLILCQTRVLVARCCTCCLKTKKKKSEKAVSRFHHWLASLQRNKSQTAHLFIKEADNGLYAITIRTNWIPGACFVWSWWVQKQQKKNKKNTDAHAETSRLLCQLYDMAVFFHPHKWTVHRGASVFVIVCFVAAAIFYLRMVRINQIVRRASPPAPGVNANLSAAAADGRCN